MCGPPGACDVQVQRSFRWFGGRRSARPSSFCRAGGSSSGRFAEFVGLRSHPLRVGGVRLEGQRINGRGAERCIARSRPACAACSGHYLRIGGRRAGRAVWEAVERRGLARTPLEEACCSVVAERACCRSIPAMSPGRQGCGRSPAHSSRRPGGPRRGRPASDPRRAGRPQATALQRGSAWERTPAGLPGGEAHTVVPEMRPPPNVLYP